jgi:hypothetical protein
MILPPKIAKQCNLKIGNLLVTFLFVINFVVNYILLKNSNSNNTSVW